MGKKYVFQFFGKIRNVKRKKNPLFHLGIKDHDFTEG